ncbi:hypothetical protein ABIC90_000121 [Variovorax boronicumulans]
MHPWDCMSLVWVFVFRGRVSARRPTYFLLLRQKNVSKEKATLLSATPSLRYGATCGARVSRGLAQTRCAQTRARPDPRNAALLGAYRRALGCAIAALGFQHNSGHRCARLAPSPLGERVGVRVCGVANRALCLPPSQPSPSGGRGKSGLPSEAKARMKPEAERSKGPCGLHPSGCAEERSGSRIRARSCLSATKWSEFCETPRTASTAGCPVATRRGRRQRGRLSFAYFSLAKQRKVGRPPGRDPAPEQQPRQPANAH